MRIVILSTETKHHTYFINKLARLFEIAGIIYERRRLAKSYPTAPFFAEEEDAFEERFFDPAYGGTLPNLPSELERRVVCAHGVNQVGMPEYIRALEPDVGITFGVGKVSARLFGVPRYGMINVHRGIAGEYRGLDSDLWAIYENRFDQVGVTIHQVDEEFDTGDILAQERVSVYDTDEIYHLKYKTTVVATRLVIDVLMELEDSRKFLHKKKQEKFGRYISAMSLDQKYEALRRFTAFKESSRRGR